MNMKISNRVAPLPLPSTESIQTGRKSNTAPSARTIPAAVATGARALFAEKLGGFRADALSAGLRLFSEPSVKTAMTYVKSAVANLSGSVAHAFSALTVPASQVAPEPGRQAPQRSIAQDPGFSAAFDKWVQDNKFEGAKQTAAKPANEALSRPRVTLPNVQPAPTAAAQGARSEPFATQARESEHQAPQRSIAQDPGFGAAFDKWVLDNKFEGAKPTPAKPANEKIAQTPVTPPTAQPAAVVVPQVHVEAPLPRTSVSSAKAAAQPPAPVSVRTRRGPLAPAATPQESPAKAAAQPPAPVSVRTRQERPVPAAAQSRQERPAPVPIPREAPATATAQPPAHAAVHARPAPALVRARQERPMPAGNPTAALLNRKQELNSSQSGLLSLMSQLGEIRQTKEKASTSGDKIPARTATEAVASEAAHVEPRGKVYTNPAAFAKALDKWERDNHFDHDNPMPAGHVSEPRPEFKSTARLADRSEALPSAAEVEARRQAEINSHQEAVNAGYR